MSFQFHFRFYQVLLRCTGFSPRFISLSFRLRFQSNSPKLKRFHKCDLLLSYRLSSAILPCSCHFEQSEKSKVENRFAGKDFGLLTAFGNDDREMLGMATLGICEIVSLKLPLRIQRVRVIFHYTHFHVARSLFLQRHGYARVHVCPASV